MWRSILTLFPDLPLFLPTVVFVGVCGVVGFGPLMVYLAILSRANERPTPVVVSGPSDLVGLLAGLSGFIVMGAVLVVLAVETNSRYMIRGDWESLRTAWADEQGRWLMSVVGYLLVVIGAAGAGLLARSGKLSVYNVDRVDLESVIAESLSDLGFSAHRMGTVWSDGKELVRIDPTSTLRHAMVTFSTADPRMREELDRSVRLRLAAVSAPDHLAGVWLLSASISCLITLSACTFIIGYFAYLTV